MRTIPAGYEARLSIVVTDEMTVDFEQLGRVHPVYATYWLAKHMEEAGRKIILPFLEEGEEGIGAAVSVQHLGSALPGMELEVVARHERTDGARIHASCRAINELGDVVGEGTTEQVVLPRAELERRLEELEGRAAAQRFRP